MKSLHAKIQLLITKAIEQTQSLDAEGLAEKVHVIRKHGKRIRSWLFLLRKSESATAIRKRVQKASEILSALRDTHVILQTAEQARRALPSGGPPVPDDAAWGRFVDFLAIDPAQNAPVPETLLQRAHAELQGACDAFRQIKSDTRRSDVFRALGRSYARSRRTTQRLFLDRDVDAFHDLRKATKRFYYQCELVMDAYGWNCEETGEQARSLSERLGEALDLELLCNRLESWTAHESNSSAFLPIMAYCNQQRQDRLDASLTLACRLFFRTRRDFLAEATTRSKHHSPDPRG